MATKNRSLTLQLQVDDNGETVISLEDKYVDSNGNGSSTIKRCENIDLAIATFLRTLFRDKSIVVLAGNGDLHRGVSARPFFKTKSGSANDILSNWIPPEYVYFIFNPKTELIKVGKTNNVKRRLSTIRREMKSQCELLHRVRCIQVNAYDLEAKLHHYLKCVGCHVTGEWFNIPDGDKKIIFDCTEGYELLNIYQDWRKENRD